MRGIFSEQALYDLRLKVANLHRGSDPIDLVELTHQNTALLSWAARFHFGIKYPHQSAAIRFNATQKTTGLFLLVAICILLFWQARWLLVSVNTLFTVFCLALITLRVWLFRLSLMPQQQFRPTSHAGKQPQILPAITILVPLYREAESLPYLHAALQALDYPKDKLDIKLLLEEDDPQTLAAAVKICTGIEYHLITVPASAPRTKPKACNYGLWLARGEYTVIYDAEDRPEPDQLIKAVKQYAECTPQTACLQAKLNYYNRSRNLLTRLFTLEYTLLFDVILPGLVQLGTPVPLGGTSNFFRTDVLLKVGGWDPHNVTEDADIGLRLAAQGYKVEMLNSTTWEEATSSLSGWLRQRSRWIKGYMQTWLTHMRRPDGSSSETSFWQRHLTLQLVVGGVIISALLNPLFWLLYLAWLYDGPFSVDVFFPPPLGTIATFSFLCCNLLLIYLYLAAPLKRRWYSFCSISLFFPFYWLLQSIAGFMALWQFLRDPFYWEKTDHHPEEYFKESVDSANLS